MHMYFVSCVLNTLFHNIFDVVRSAVRIVSSPGDLMRFPPAVMWTWLGPDNIKNIVEQCVKHTGHKIHVH